VCIVAIFAAGFFPTYCAQITANQETSYAIARGCGTALRLFLASLFIPTLRKIHAKTYEFMPASVKTSVIGHLFHGRMLLHKGLGMAFIGTAVAHAGAHVHRRSVPVLALESGTGSTILTLVTLPILSMYALRSSHQTWVKWADGKSYYFQFLLPHQIAWWGIVAAYAVHTPDRRLAPEAASCFGLFCVDRIWEWMESRNIKVLKVEKIHDKMMLFQTKKPRNFNYQTGQKVYLAYPPETAFINNLHPFTIASSPNEGVVRFVISDSGWWTRDLIKSLKRGATVRISPAFPSPLDLTDIALPRMLITSGSGIAMTLAHLYDDRDKSLIRAVHTTRYREEFALLNRCIKESGATVVSVQYYDTSGNSKARLRSEGEPTDAETVDCRFEPGSHVVLGKYSGRIYFCGSEKLGDSVEKVVQATEESVFIRERFSF
jgi:ferredoxin-NADP reductase